MIRWDPITLNKNPVFRNSVCAVSFHLPTANPSHRHTTLDIVLNYSNYFTRESFRCMNPFQISHLRFTHSHICMHQIRSIQFQQENKLWNFLWRETICELWIAGNWKATNYLTFLLYPSWWWISLLKSYFSFVS